ncbi:hypothetical protein [Ralstonia phage phiRSL1]|uniref:Uncharacterized protein n=1 Tax=Ralstonia phage phiRSL1 TaxID=1980924 RepID=B2ZY03_9CAUD|nr:hypothetical protein RSL1_ORF144 [Ralstonia phage phiRSL1]BAG41589.2 hypothetical protein [Ralstonia phage phiRSL1]
MKSGYLSTNTRISSFAQIQLYFPLVYSSLLNTQDTLTVVATQITTNSHAAATIGWSEYY